MAFSGRGRIETSEGNISPVQLLILTLLNRGPAHGYRVLRELQEGIRGWKLESGTIYPALRRLAERGFITSEEVSHKDRPDTVSYQLTAQGKSVLREAFKNLKEDFRVQRSLWRFLAPSINGDAQAVLLRSAMQEGNPFGFIAMRHQCRPGHCDRVHLDFLKRYREYLKKELDSVNQQLARLKGSKENDES